jgi:hypothetical protein
MSEISGSILLSKTRRNEKSQDLTKVIGDVKEPIFNIKKYFRNGMLEKKIMKKYNKMNVGKWTRKEHRKFVSACIKYGTNWNNVRI